MPIIADVMSLVATCDSTWHDMPEVYWLGRLMQEVSDVAVAMAGEGEHAAPSLHSVDFELKQIASICINWLEMRQDRV